MRCFCTPNLLASKLLMGVFSTLVMLQACSGQEPHAPIEGQNRQDPIKLSVDDHAVFNAVVADVVDNPEANQPEGERIRVLDRLVALSPHINEAQLRSDTDSRDIDTVLALLSELRSRNQHDRAVAHRFDNPVVELIDHWPSGYDYSEPDDVRQTMAFLAPAYSEDGRIALVRARIAWVHGGTATYLLEKKQDQWRIRWAEYAYYL